jgi:protein TonB
MDSTASAILAASAPAPVRARERRDPLTLILGTGETWSVFSICVAVALALHVAMLVFALVSAMLKDLHDAVVEDRARIHDYFFRLYDVEVIKPKEPPPPEPPPPEPPPPEPVAAPRPTVKVQEDDIYKNVAVPAQAAKVLTAEAKEDEPVDLTGFVTGDGTALGGMQSGAGKGDRVTMQRNAAHDGVPGGKDKVNAAPPPPPAEDRSRPVGLGGGGAANCPFPPEADQDQIDQATASIQITVRPDGSVLSATVLSDPGHGFGRAARICLLGRHFQPALDRTGTPIVSSAPVNVRFNR